MAGNVVRSTGSRVTAAQTQLSESLWQDLSLPSGQALQHARLGELFQILERGLNPHSCKLDQCVETELRYFSLLSDVREDLDLGASKPCRIVQHYFSKDLIPILSWFAFRAVGASTEWNRQPVTKARIRSVEDERGGYSYALELKGPKLGFSRFEITLPIGEECFIALIPFTDGSRVGKQRHEFEARAGRQHRVQLHVDLLESFGDTTILDRPGRIAWGKQEIDFAVLEVEVSSLRAIESILEGNHDLPVLDKAIPLWEQGDKKRKALSSWRLAHEGADKRFFKALEYFARKSA